MPSILDFSLRESKPQLIQKLGSPDHATHTPAYQVLEYVLAPEGRDDEDFDWSFYFQQPAGELLSVTRNFVRPEPVEALFPPKESQAFENGTLRLSVLARVVDQDRVLLGIGISKPAERCSQVILMRRAALARFYPWVKL